MPNITWTLLLLLTGWVSVGLLVCWLTHAKKEAYLHSLDSSLFKKFREHEHLEQLLAWRDGPNKYAIFFYFAVLLCFGITVNLLGSDELMIGLLELSNVPDAMPIDLDDRTTPDSTGLQAIVQTIYGLLFLSAVFSCFASCIFVFGRICHALYRGRLPEGFKDFNNLLNGLFLMKSKSETDAQWVTRTKRKLEEIPMERYPTLIWKGRQTVRRFFMWAYFSSGTIIFFYLNSYALLEERGILINETLALTGTYYKWSEIQEATIVSAPARRPSPEAPLVKLAFKDGSDAECNVVRSEQILDRILKLFEAHQIELRSDFTEDQIKQLQSESRLSPRVQKLFRHARYREVP